MTRTITVPLAWLNITHNKRRFAASLTSLAFAVVLMFTQIGFRNALLDSTVELIRRLNGELILVSRMKYTLSVKETFPNRRLVQALSVKDVQGAYALYIEKQLSTWKNREQGTSRTIRVLGFDPQDPVLSIPEAAEHAAALMRPDTVLFDAKSRRAYGKFGRGIRAELADNVVEIVGLFALGTDFSNDGNVLMSDKNFVNHFSSRRDAETRHGAVDIGVIQVAPEADLAAVKESLMRALPADIVVMTKNEFITQEIDFWLDSTPIGFIFGLGTLLGFAVGVIICYQILYTEVSSQLNQFATMKAMGFQNRHLVTVVVQGAVLLALLSFAVGLFVSWIGYSLLAGQTGLLLRLTPLRVALVFTLTLVMCVVAACVSVRKVFSLDPAELF